MFSGLLPCWYLYPQFLIFPSRHRQLEVSTLDWAQSSFTHKPSLCLCRQSSRLSQYTHLLLMQSLVYLGVTLWVCTPLLNMRYHLLFKSFSWLELFSIFVICLAISPGLMNLKQVVKQSFLCWVGDITAMLNDACGGFAVNAVHLNATEKETTIVRGRKRFDAKNNNINMSQSELSLSCQSSASTNVLILVRG